MKTFQMDAKSRFTYFTKKKKNKQIKNKNIK